MAGLLLAPDAPGGRIRRNTSNREEYPKEIAMFEVGPAAVFVAIAVVPMLSILLLGPLLTGHWLARRALARWMDRQSQHGWAPLEGRRSA